MVILPAGKAVLFTATPVDSAFHPASWGETFLRWKALHEQGYFRGSHQYTLRNEWYKRGEGRLLFSLPLRLRDYNLCWHCTGWVLKNRVLSYLPPPPCSLHQPEAPPLFAYSSNAHTCGGSEPAVWMHVRARTHTSGGSGRCFACSPQDLSFAESLSLFPSSAGLLSLCALSQVRDAVGAASRKLRFEG